MRQMFRVFEIGTQGSLDPSFAQQKARSVARTMAQLSPRVSVMFSIGGYHDDRREIWDIPEARDYVIAFWMALSRLGVTNDRLLPQTVNLIKACYAVHAGHVVYTLGDIRDTKRVISEQISDHFVRKAREVH